MSLNQVIGGVVVIGLILLCAAALTEFLEERIKRRWFTPKDQELPDPLGLVILVGSLILVMLMIGLAEEIPN